MAPLFSKNVELGPALKTSAWRKIAIGTWRRNGDPSVYGILEFDCTKMLEYLKKIQAKSTEKITVTHFMGKAIGDTFAKHPQLNCVLRWGKLYPRKNVDVFFQVASDVKGEDLSGCTIRRADQKTITEIAVEMKGHIHHIREKGDPAFKKSKNTMKLVPGFLVGPLLDFLGFVLYTLNIWTPLIGSPKDPFGTVMITNVGSLGLDLAFAPLVPYSRVPVLLAVAAIKDTPVVRNGQIVSAPIMKIGVTVDHRLIDGMHGSKMFKTISAVFNDPETHLGTP
jgi:pyruvate/2-oxoglutarate dehydrogenase complex dihydrolipoamide acyltransferase (E2) component